MGSKKKKTRERVPGMAFFFSSPLVCASVPQTEMGQRKFLISNGVQEETEVLNKQRWNSQMFFKTRYSIAHV